MTSKPDSRSLKSDQLRSFDLGSDEYFQVQSDTAYKRVNVDSTFIQDTLYC